MQRLGRLLLLGVTGCTNVIVGAPTSSTVPLRFSGSPAQATVLSDDQRAGSLDVVAARGVRVLPGKHHVTIEAVGYLPFDTEIDAQGPLLKIDARLTPIPD
jgi:hypothetical protein